MSLFLNHPDKNKIGQGRLFTDQAFGKICMPLALLLIQLVELHLKKIKGKVPFVYLEQFYKVEVLGLGYTNYY